MRILLLTQLFQPEPNHLKGLTFARELMRQGHEVEVLTGFPNYPGGRIYEGYRIGLRERETLDGVPIVRVALYPSHNSSGLKRLATYASFAASASLLGPCLIRRPDVVHVYQGPATLCLPAMAFSAFFNAPYVLDVQDLWPDSVTASGMFNIPCGSDLLHMWSKLSYKSASKIVVLSEGYKSTLVERGVPLSKIAVVYNWCDESRMLTRRDSDHDDAVSSMQGKFNVVFAGNMGRVQGLETVVEAASLVRTELPQVQFVLVGDGVDVNRLKVLAGRLGAANVLFVPRQPVDKIGRILAAADALVIHLKDDPLCCIGIPQKTQAYMAAGKPIIMAVRGDSCELVRRSGAGVICDPENPQDMANAVRLLLGMTPKERETLGERGRRFYTDNLSFRVGVERMISIFQEVIDERQGFLSRTARPSLR